MPANLAIQRKWASPRFLDQLGTAGAPIGRERLGTEPRDRAELHRLQKQVQADQADLAEAIRWLKEVSGQPAPNDLDAAWLAQAREDACAKEKSASDHFNPVITKLKGLLSPVGSLPPEVEQLILEGIAILKGWLDFYRGLREMLTHHLAERGVEAASSVLRARPATGKIDYSALSREHIRRFPKIRARLAE